MTLIEQVGETNVLYVSAMICLVLIVASVCVTRMITHLFRGYPPLPEGPELPECNHDDNKTGLCIRRPFCQTENQCNETVNNQD